MSKCLFFLLMAAVSLTAYEVLTEAKVGYYLPTDSKFRHAYGEDGIIGGLESSFATDYNLFPWISVSMFRNSHHSKELAGKSQIYTLPIGIGLKYIYFFDRLGVYGGAGVLPTYVHIHNYSPLAIETQKKWGCGGTVKVGFLADRLWNFFLDLFAEYSYTKVHFSHHDHVELNPVNLGNFTIGGAVGYHFGYCPCECDDDED